MVAETEYLIKILKESGIRSNVYTSFKKLKQGNELQVAAVLRNGEAFGRSGSKKTYTEKIFLMSLDVKILSNIFTI